MTPAQKRIAIAYLRDAVISDLEDCYGDAYTVDGRIVWESDRELVRAMRAAVRALRGVKATKKGERR